MIVAIEGIDGVGKTTVAGLLRSAIRDSEVLHTPPRTYYEGNYEILRDLECCSRAVLFVAGALAVNERLIQQTPSTIRIIDRFSGSVTGMNRFLIPHLGDACRQLSLVMPDLTILLVCDESQRRLRLRRRGRPLDPFERMLEDSEDLRRAMHESVKEASCPLVTIDNTHLSTTDTADICLYHIQKALPLQRDVRVMDTNASESLRARLVEESLPKPVIGALFRGDCPHPEFDGDGGWQLGTSHPYRSAPPRGSADPEAVGITVQRATRAALEALEENVENSDLRSQLMAVTGDLERAVAGDPIDSARLNRALSLLQILLKESGDGAVISILSQWIAGRV